MNPTSRMPEPPASKLGGPVHVAESLATLEHPSPHNTAPRNLTLKRKLHAIMCEVDYIQKDKKNDYHRYSYASEAAIRDRRHAMFVKYGILFTCDPVPIVSERELPTKNGTEVVTTMPFHYCFEDVDSEEKREGSFFGTGADSADKGVYKCITGAIKYCLTTAFLIPNQYPSLHRPTQELPARASVPRSRIILPFPARHAAGSPNPVAQSPSIGCASCRRSTTRTRSGTPPAKADEVGPVRRIPVSRSAWSTSARYPGLRRAVLQPHIIQP